MPTYRITAPDGRSFNVTGDGTADEAIAHIQSQYSAPKPVEKPIDHSAGGGRLSIAGLDTGINTPQWLDRGLAGIGKAVVDTGRGIGQLVAPLADANASAYASQHGLPYQGNENQVAARQGVTDSRQNDAPLMKTGMGKLGNFAGTAAMIAPTMAIPGANTVTGAGLIGAATGMIQPAETGTERAMNVGLGGALGAGAQYVGQKVAQGVSNRLVAREAKAVADKAQNVVRDATLKEAQAAGYVVPPTTTNPTMINRLIEGAAGKITTAQAASMKNMGVTNRLVRESLGLADDAPLTIQTLDEIRKPAGQVYEAIKNFGDIAADGTYTSELKQLVKSSDEILAAYPDAKVGAAEEIGKLVKSLQQDKVPASAAVEYLKDLRAQASSNLSFQAAADPAKKALGRAQRDAAGALEDLILRNLKNGGQGDLAMAFDKARTTIAKTYSVQSALNESTGNVVATALGSQLKRGKPLTGGLRTAAKFARAFPKVAKEVTESMPGVSPLDLYGSLIASGASGNPLPMLYPAGRMAARGAQMTGLGQRMAVPNYAPSAMGTRALQGARGLGQAAVPLALSVQASQQ